MRILFLCDRIYWQNKVPRTRFHAVEAIGKIAEVVSDGPARQLSIRCNVPDIDAYDWILVYKPEQYIGWHEDLPPVVTTFNDAWETKSRIRDIRLPRCKVVIMHHANEMDVWQTRMPDVKFVNIPYPINPSVFRDYGLPKTTDILLTGCVDEKIYPLRYRFAQLIKAGAFAPYKAEIRKHPGYRLADPEQEAIDYAKALNSARICLVDPSKYGYAAEKYHEIPACGSVLCGYVPDERQDEFSDFMIPIHPKADDELIVRTIKDYLSFPTVLEDMSRRGMEYVHSQFTVDHYAQRFLEALSQ